MASERLIKEAQKRDVRSCYVAAGERGQSQAQAPSGD